MLQQLSKVSVKNYYVALFLLQFSLPLIIIFRPFILIKIPNFLINEIKPGSIAQFDRTVLPSAPQAAINAFSVAPTETDGNLKITNQTFFSFCNYNPSLSEIFLRQINGYQLVDFPIAQPPGNETIF